MANVVSAKTKGRLTKKELKQDKLVELTYKTEAFYHAHRNLVLGVAGAIVVALIAVWFIQGSVKSSRDQENFDLTMAKMNYGSGQLESAKTSFSKVLAQYSGSAAGEAQYFLARIAFEQNDFANAETAFRKYLDQYSIDNMMDCAATTGLAATLEALGKQDAAAKMYEQAATKFSKEPYAAQSLLDAGRIYMSINQIDNAKRVYQMIVDKYPESSNAQSAKKELDQIK